MRVQLLPWFRSLAVFTAAGFLSSAVLAQSTDSPKLAHSLQAKDGTAAWTELQDAGHPPPSPKEWAATPPTPKEKETFYLPYVAALVDKAKDFYTRFPADSHVPEAKIDELRYLMMTVSWGDTRQQSRLDALETKLLSDKSIPSDQHFMILWNMAQAAPPEKAKPLLQEIVDGAAPDKMKEAAAGMLKHMSLKGQPLDLAFTAVDGRPVDLSKLRGKVVLIDFWATWCGPCRGEVPNVKKTYDQFHSKGFEIVGISLDRDKDSLTKFVAENKMEWPQYFDGEDKYAKQFGIESIPAMWLIDKSGKIRDMNAREDLASGVQKLLAE